MERPLENLIRADTGNLALRTDGESGMPTLTGRFASPGEWTEIRSVVEGHFMERFSARAFEKTITESTKNMRVLFHHGLDPSIGMKVLGPIHTLGSDTAYEVPLLDTEYNRSLVPGLEAGLYGSSFKFAVVQQEQEDKPVRSDFNPKAIPQVTITEAKVVEFGPTPLPAYKGTSAGLRSVTDEFLLAHLQADPERLAVLAGVLRAAALEPQKPDASTSDGDEPLALTAATPTGEEKPAWFLE